MIVVLGRPALGGSADGSEPHPVGRAGRIAVAIATAGARVELVGSVGDDAAGDQVAVALGRAGVGHAALLRDPSASTPVGDPVAGPPPSGITSEAPGSMPLPRLDAADVELGLRYLSECRVLVVADALSDDAAVAAAEAASYHAAALVAVVPRGDAVAAAFVDVATVLEDDGAEGAEDADMGAFTDLVATFAVALDAGREPREAFAVALRSASWEPAAE